ncbi:MFS transporter [Kitasatospora sp. NPDC056138]|uniref:MFS transporter n=1 Tax=Kitasatospora sp. NPDC056138 TaxID=3345724 RepID=UPI0035E1FA61
MIDTHQRNTALLVAGCFFMENLDGTIVATAAPRMAASLHIEPTAVGLVITAYLLTLAVLIPLSGWLAARYGVRRIFLTAISLFTLASLACALSTNLWQLVAMRVLQGIGGAMMVPVGRLTVMARTAKPDIPKTMAYIVWPGLVAPVIAPLLGGFITTYADWRWMFLVNLPLGLVALLVARRLLDSTSTTGTIPTTNTTPATNTIDTTNTKSTTPSLDRIGVLLTATGLGAFTWAAHLLSEPAEPWAPVLLALGLSAVLLTAAVRHLLRTEHPLISLRTLKVPTFRASVTGGTAFWIAVGAVPFLLPLLFQEVFGWSAIKSGTVVLFVFVGNIGIKPATTYLLNRFGFRRLLLGATLGVTATLVASAFLTSATPLALVVVLTVISGAARSVGLTGYMTIAFSEVTPEQLRHANTLSATAQQLAAGLGVAAATVALRAGGAIGELLPGTPTAGTAYAVAFGLLALVTLTAVVGAYRLHPGAGDAVRRSPVTAGKRPVAQS